MKYFSKLIVLIAFATISFIASDSVLADIEPPSYCDQFNCYVHECTDNGCGYIATGPNDSEPPSYCDGDNCYVYECTSPGSCSWSLNNPQVVGQACTATGCYQYQCSGSGMSRSCAWVFEERDPFPVYNSIE